MRMLLILALAAFPLKSLAQEARFPVFGESEARRAFFENQAQQAAERAAEVQAARASALQNDGAADAQDGDARAPLPGFERRRVGYGLPLCKDGRIYQRPLEGSEGPFRRAVEPTRCSYGRRGTTGHPGFVIIVGSDGRLRSVHPSGISLVINFGK